MKIRRTTTVLFFVFLGYVATWYFAPPLARRACEMRAKQLYAEALSLQEFQKGVIIEEGLDLSTFVPSVSKKGPSVETGFTIPILPGVLLMNNSYGIGPRNGSSQVTIFFFYGFGICRICEVVTWIS